MRVRIQWSCSTVAIVVLRDVAALVAALGAACAAAQNISISVGPNQALGHPAAMTILPDEHTTIVPPQPGSKTYLFFAAGNVAPGVAGTVVLQTTDLTNFTLATGYDSPVMSPPVRFTTCNTTYDSEFDENYASQGSVLQDPTLPPGNLMMFYEAENHCPGGVWQQPYYATIGFARSSDDGVTWPAPVNGALGGPDRYPVLKLAAPEPASEPSPAPMGNAIPAAFVDQNSVYVTYAAPPGPGGAADGKLRIARAQLGGAGRLQFLKWYTGAFSQPGIGGLDSGFLPSGGCVGFQSMGSISLIDALGLYLMTFVCGNNKSDPPPAQWYFSTATSLALQDWSVPQPIANSQFPLYTPCPGNAAQGASFDGWYPSFMTPDLPSGHLGLSGHVFFLNGCDVSTDRAFTSRAFTITVNPAAPNYEGTWWAAPPGSQSGWGINFTHQDDTIFATWFTFGLDGKPLWLVVAATKIAPNVYSGALYTATGPPFDSVPFDPAKVVGTQVGTATFTFTDDNDATFAYSVNGVAQQKSITREIFASYVPTCVWGAQPKLASASNFQDMWWAAPPGSQSGWGINFAQQDDTIFATWFTFGLDGNPVWFVVAATKTAPQVYSGTLYTGTGPPFDAVPFDPSMVVPMAVGSATFTFADGNTATFAYTVNGITQQKTITREVFAPPGTVCG